MAVLKRDNEKCEYLLHELVNKIFNTSIDKNPVDEQFLFMLIQKNSNKLYSPRWLIIK